MAQSATLTVGQLQDLIHILEQRHELLQKQESLNFGNLISVAKEGKESEREEVVAQEANASAEQQLSERHTNELHGIEHAFLRIHQETYGTCADCQSTIDFQRLLAYPTALRCMKCQEIYELVARRGYN